MLGFEFPSIVKFSSTEKEYDPNPRTSKVDIIKIINTG
jgi:hypothetical protein